MERPPKYQQQIEQILEDLEKSKKGLPHEPKKRWTFLRRSINQDKSELEQTKLEDRDDAGDNKQAPQITRRDLLMLGIGGALTAGTILLFSKNDESTDSFRPEQESRRYNEFLRGVFDGGVYYVRKGKLTLPVIPELQYPHDNNMLHPGAAQIVENPISYATNQANSETSLEWLVYYSEFAKKLVCVPNTPVNGEFIKTPTGEPGFTLPSIQCTSVSHMPFTDGNVSTPLLYAKPISGEQIMRVGKSTIIAPR